MQLKYQVSLADSIPLEDYQARKGRELPLPIMKSRAGPGIAEGWNYWLGLHRELGSENRTRSTWEEFIGKVTIQRRCQGHQQRQERERTQDVLGTQEKDPGDWRTD